MDACAWTIGGGVSETLLPANGKSIHDAGNQRLGKNRAEATATNKVTKTLRAKRLKEEEKGETNCQCHPAKEGARVNCVVSLLECSCNVKDVMNKRR